MAKKILSILLCVAMLFALVACGNSNTNNKPQNEDLQENDASTVQNEKVDENATLSSSSNRYEKVTLAYSEALDTLTPDGGTKGGAKSAILTSIMEGLFIVQDGDFFPIMAKEWKHVDATHTEVEIYDYIYDSDGNHITADDVVYSYEYFSKNGTIPKFNLYGGIEKIGDYTVRFTWTGELSAILALEHVWGGTPVISKTAHEKYNFATDPVGTGPYKLSEFQAGLKVVLEARDDYWQKDELRPAFSQANVQTVQYDIITESAQRIIALETDTVDFSSGIAFDSLGAFQEGGKKADLYTVDVRATGSTCTLNPNCDPSSPCSDINLRLAIFYALNNEALAVAYPLGGAVAATGLGSTYFKGYDAAWDTEENYITKYDPALAKEYLSKSSYNNEELVILCESGDSVQIAETVQNLLLEVGIQTKINAYDYATWLNTQKDPANFDIIMMNGGGSNAHISLGWNRPFTNTDWGTGKTIGYVDSPELTELLATIKTANGGTPENVEKFRHMWMDNAYCYPTFNKKTFNVYQSEKFATLFYNCDGLLIPNACTYIIE